MEGSVAALRCGKAVHQCKTANALPVYCHALPVALSVFWNKKIKTIPTRGQCYSRDRFNSKLLTFTVSVYVTIRPTQSLADSADETFQLAKMQKIRDFKVDY